MFEETATGLLATIDAKLGTIVQELRSGGVDHFETLSWAAGQAADYQHQGAFEGLAIFNQGDTDAFVGLSPNTGRQAATAVLTLRAREWIALPVRGSVVSIGGAAAGSATVVPLSEAPSFAAGTFGGGSSSIADPTSLAGAFVGSDAAWIGNEPTNGLLTRSIPYMWAGTGGYLRLRVANVFKVVNNVVVTAETTIWTPPGGKKFRLMGFQLVASAAGIVTLRDNTGGTVIYVINSPAGGAPITSPPLGNGLLSAAVNNVLTAQLSVPGNLVGVVFGTEE